MEDFKITNEQQRLLEKTPGVLCGTDKLGYYAFVRGRTKEELKVNIYKTLKII